MLPNVAEISRLLLLVPESSHGQKHTVLWRSICHFKSPMSRVSAKTAIQTDTSHKHCLSDPIFSGLAKQWFWKQTKASSLQIWAIMKDAYET